MPRGPYTCGLDAAMDVVGGKWTALILWELRDEPRRFGQLRQALAGISEKMLIQRLREMESDSIVHRRAYDQVPPKVEYGLTELGVTLYGTLLPLVEWGERYVGSHIGDEPVATVVSVEAEHSALRRQSA